MVSLHFLSILAKKSIRKLWYAYCKGELIYLDRRKVDICGLFGSSQPMSGKSFAADFKSFLDIGLYNLSMDQKHALWSRSDEHFEQFYL